MGESSSSSSPHTSATAESDPGPPPGPRDGGGGGDGGPLSHTQTHAKQVWKFRLRPDDDDEPEDWWFASTAIPLLAATIGPLANVLSIAALVVPWRADYDPSYPGQDAYSIGFRDPRWCVSLNALSLVCGLGGNIFLLFNFTRRVRYIIALPMTIILWYFATFILMAITISMNRFVPPHPTTQVYSQGFWHAIIAACLYLLCSMLLMVNMVGYMLGHYTRHFDLTDEQRNLILQTMVFFIWLAGGGGIFARMCGWTYTDALYFCDVTVLTVGFGDFTGTNDAARGLVFPYSVGGIIFLGLMVSSISNFAGELSRDKVIRHHVERKRVRTLTRSDTASIELAKMELQARRVVAGNDASRPNLSDNFEGRERQITFDLDGGPGSNPEKSGKVGSIRHGFKALRRVRGRQTKPRLLYLREEKDRFTAMRQIQQSTSKFKRYYALTMSVIAFGLLWCVGAAVFWQAERSQQDLNYFEALYFCYVSLLTIGYGDFAPKSNVGKPFFIVWSLIAVPTMTILVSDMGSTVIASYKRAASDFADFTVLPKAGIWRAYLNKHPRLLNWLQSKADQQKARRGEKRRLQEGFPTGPEEEELDRPPPTLEQLADEDVEDEHEMAHKLALAIRRTANDLKTDVGRRYTYEEWVEYTRLIRFSRMTAEELEEDEVEEGLIEWDWIGPDSPMMATQTECEWVLDRLCESLNRYMRRQVPEHVKVRRKSVRAEKSLDLYRRASQGA